MTLMYIPGETFASTTVLSAQTNFDFFWDCHAVENCRRRKLGCPENTKSLKSHAPEG